MSDIEYSRPEASHLPKKTVFEIAEFTYDKLGLAPAADLYELVLKLGGHVEVEETFLDDPEKSGSLYVDDVRDFRIIVPSHTSPKRDRFTIAHELGHFFIHYVLQKRHLVDDKKKMCALRKDSERVEWEANWFAAAFLMPEGEFKAAFKKFSGNISEVADFFDVSFSAAQLRAGTLKLT